MELNTQYNYYDILEVDSICPQNEITQAYERARSTYSGDNPAIYTMFTKEEAREMLKLIEEAYSVLGNKTLRSLYDEKVGKKVPLSEVSFQSLQVESKAAFHTPIKSAAPQKIEFTQNPEMEKEIKAATDFNGEMLKKIREYKKIQIERLSDVTKISSYYIKAIESCDAANLPSAVFVRGYVSQISKILGLDDKKVCDSYMKHYKSALEKK
jgi:DnaJ-class molecular chaperone